MQSGTDSLSTLVGRPAPDFSVECAAVDGVPRRRVGLTNFHDRWLVLVFYPADFSLVCPTELTALNEHYDEFVEAGADILAISTDSLELHERWLATPRARGGVGGLRFRVGSDPDGEVTSAYGVYLAERRVALRGLFMIDPAGIVQYQVVHNLNVGRRNDEILRVLDALQTGGLCPENWQPGRRPIDPTAELLPGSRISHYTIEARIGVGAFAAVYRAFDERLGRFVALKILRPREGEPPSVQAEARAAAALSHPNVCAVYGIEDGEGVPMIVMEHLVGRPLTKLIEAGSTPVSEAVEIARQIAAGMAAAHDAGVTHGDLKPANIMLTADGTVKILDFGLSFRHRVDEASDSTVFVGSRLPGMIAGTPSYMSPEQVEGGACSPASDVFSFGLLLYELLRGRRTFGDKNVLQVLSEIRMIDPAAFAANVDEPFRSLLPRMLARTPAERTITMRQIADELAAWRAGVSV